jgi:hypothetical protein
MTAVGKNATARAHQLIDGASFGPEALKAIGEAFDAAWAEIAGNFGDDAEDVEKARHASGWPRPCFRLPVRTVEMSTC